MLATLLISPIGLLMAIGLSGFKLDDAVNEFDQARLLELLLLAWLSAIAFWLTANNQFKIPTCSYASLSLFVFLILGLTSSAFAKYPLEALQDWAHYALLILLIVVLANLASQNLVLAVKILMAGIVLGISIALARFIIQVILTLSLNVVTPLAQWWSSYTNPRFIAQVLVWIIPLLIALPSVWPAFRKRSLVAAYALCSGVWMLLFWTGSRAELLSLALSMGLVAALMWRRAFSFMTGMTLTALAGFSLWLLTRLALNFGVTGGASLSFARFGVSGRDWLAERSLQLITQHPWLGVGPAHFSTYNPQSSAPSAHPHNLILQIAAEWGLPAAALLIYLLWKFVRRQYQSAKNAQATFDSANNIKSTLKIPLLITLFAVILTSMLDGIHVMPLSELIGVPVLGLMIAINTPVEHHESQLREPYMGKLITILVTFCWGILLFSIFQQRDCLTYPIRAEQLIKGRVGYDNPRFWVQGRIPLGEGCTEISRYQNGLDTLTGQSVDAPSTTEQYWR